MSAVTAEQFKQEMIAEGKIFLNKDDSEIQVILDRVERLYCPVDVWGDDQFDGIVQRTAHIIQLAYLEEQRRGAMAAKAAKGEPVEMSGFSSDEANLKLTSYGQTFIELRDSLATTLGIAFG